MRLQQLFEVVGNTVYHICSKAAYAQIKQNGLVPQTRSSSENWAHINYGAPSTFVFPKWDKESINEVLTVLSNKYLKPGEDHEDWDDAEWDAFTNDLVGFPIDLSKCPNVKFSKDPNSDQWTPWYVTTDLIPPEAIGPASPVNFDWS